MTVNKETRETINKPNLDLPSNKEKNIPRKTKRVSKKAKKDEGLEHSGPQQYTKTSKNLLKQHIGQSRKFYQKGLFDDLLIDQDLRKQKIESNIQEVGANLSEKAHYALHAIQTLYTFNNYEGNTATPRKLRVTIPEYLDAYGVTKNETKRGLQYSGKARKIALEALEELEKPIFWYVAKLNKEKTQRAGAKRYDAITGVDSILKIKKRYEDLTEGELSQVKSKETVKQRLTGFEIDPQPDLFFSKSFVLIPENIFKLAKAKYRGLSTHLITLMYYLIDQANHGNYKFTRYYEVLTDTLHLKYLEDTRQKSRLYKTLETDFIRAKELGLLKDFSLDSDLKGKKVLFVLEPGAFYNGNKLKNKETKSLPEREN